MIIRKLNSMILMAVLVASACTCFAGVETHGKTNVIEHEIGNGRVLLDVSEGHGKADTAEKESGG